MEQGVPTQNFQTNDDLVGCTVHAWSGSYIYILKGDEYLAYKNITADDNFFRNTIQGISSMRMEMGMTEAYLQNAYLLALADSEHNYTASLTTPAPTRMDAAAILASFAAPLYRSQPPSRHT